MTYLGQRKINDFGLNVVERQIKASYPFETCLVFLLYTNTYSITIFKKEIPQYVCQIDEFVHITHRSLMFVLTYIVIYKRSMLLSNI